MASIELVMIVKNEEKIISRSFSYIKDIIDSYTIVDTGSTDNTVETIKKELKGISGKVYHRKWVNFATNRTQAIQLANKDSDYLLLSDADEMIIVDDNFDKEDLYEDVYRLRYQGNLDYAVPYLIKNNRDWEYKGVTHEYLEIPKNINISEISTLSIIDFGDGGSKNDKFERDIRLLEQGLEDEPNNSRYKFYLANSYRNIGDYNSAIKWYLKRIKDNGWIEEVTCSYQYLGICYLRIKDYQSAINTFLEGYQINPNRAECLYYLGKHYRETKKYHLSYQILKIGKDIPYPKNDVLFIEKNVYQYLIDYELSIVSYYVNDLKLGRELSNQLILNTGVNKNVLDNYQYYSNSINYIKIKEIDLDKYIDINDGYNSTNPSFSMKDNMFEVNVRRVNYKIDKNNFQYLNLDNKPITKAHTKNVKFRLDRNNDWKIIGSPIYINNLELKERERISGIEDIRLFNGNCFIGNIWDGDKMKVVIGNKIKDKSYQFQKLKSPYNRQFEKNWSPINHKNKNKKIFLYDWNPIQFGKVKENKLEIFKTLKTKLPGFRGSSPGYIYDNKIYFLAHIVSENGDVRKYYHSIVVFDEYLNYINHSELFTFNDKPIEFAIGFVITDDEVIISHSEWDETAKLSIYDKYKLFTEIF